MTTPIIISNIADLRRWVAGVRAKGKTIGFVPTMGALHDGHLSLVRAAAGVADLVLASIFVNPTQFSAGEDIERYPKPLAEDIAKLSSLGVSAIYTPTAAELYPAGFLTSISVKELSTILCGQSRPHHFDGVALVVAKLFLQTMPDAAIFGEKDYQQLLIIKKMVVDLNFPIQILSAPTVREKTGLAMSSRNQYLSPAEWAIAPLLYRTLTTTAAQLRQGGDPRNLFSIAINNLLSGGFERVDYLEWRASDNLATMEKNNRPSRLLIAAHLGRARLIDNIPL